MLKFNKPIQILNFVKLQTSLNLQVNNAAIGGITVDTEALKASEGVCSSSSSFLFIYYLFFKDFYVRWL